MKDVDAKRSEGAPWERDRVSPDPLQGLAQTFTTAPAEKAVRSGIINRAASVLGGRRNTGQKYQTSEQSVTLHFRFSFSGVANGLQLKAV